MEGLTLPSLRRLAVGAPKSGIRCLNTHRQRIKKPFQPELTFFPPGHGERIWVFDNMLTKQIIYSHKDVLDSNRALRQLPFNGKKTKPAKLRKDLWRRMALIQFPEGAGQIGQSVFQKLRELRMRHELSWGYQADEFLQMSRKDRGLALNDQKANSVADIAAVLNGLGKGNKIWVDEEGQDLEPGQKPAKKLAMATIYWATDRDVHWAKEWSENVTHEMGLPGSRVEPAEVGEVEQAPLEAVSQEPATENKDGIAAQS